MALEQSISTCQPGDCSELRLIDNTGLVETIDTGYGDPNLEVSAITTITITVTPASFTYPLVYVLTCSGGLVISWVVTQNGVTLDSATGLAIAIPFTEVAPFPLLAAHFGGTVVPDGNIEIEMETTDSTESYTTSFADILICNAECCRKASLLEVTDCGCHDKDVKKKLYNTFFNKVYLESAQWASDAGRSDQAAKNLLFAQNLCSNPCGNC